MALRVRRSPQTLAVLSALLSRSQSWHYGYDLLKETGLKSGTLYPILARLQRGGWLQQRWERSSAPGRPPRHMYRLSRKGKGAAREYCGGMKPSAKPAFAGTPADVP
jgi:PadR family transcriptional regulator, regulatory protein PadR